jgi:prepilin-type N-terminal cleavage/methylation domain-containing protein
MRRAFTLIELLVTIAIISILAALAMGVMQVASTAAKEAATKATIAKLHTIIMRRYESYLTRRVCLDTLGMTPGQAHDADIEARKNPKAAARYRLDAIRDLMRLEMPDAKSDIENGPHTFFWGHILDPKLHKLYASNPPTSEFDAAQCLYLIVSKGNPEAMEQFNPSEIGMIGDKPVFVDGWGNPIMFLRWAPGFRSPLQSGNRQTDHDPFDTRRVDGVAFHLLPLIYSSAGRKKDDGTPQYGIDLQAGYTFKGNPYENMDLGKMVDGEGAEGNITNHRIEQR